MQATKLQLFISVAANPNSGKFWWCNCGKVEVRLSRSLQLPA